MSLREKTLSSGSFFVTFSILYILKKDKMYILIYTNFIYNEYILTVGGSNNYDID